MAKIVIDGRMLGWTGIGRYTLNLVKQLERLDSDNDYTVLMLPKDWDLWNPATPNFHKRRSDAAPYSPAEQTKLALELYRLRPDLVHFTAQNIATPYFGRHITTIHDLTLLDYKTSRKRSAVYVIKRLLFHFDVWMAAHFSKAILVPTKFGKADLLDRYRINSDKVLVTNEAADKLIAQLVKPSYEGMNNFLLSVGNSYPYKNLNLLIEAFHESLAKHPDLKLVLVGPDDPFFDQLKSRARELEIDKSVIFTGRVSDGELVWLYQNAKLLIFPSLSEGFGLPGLEAMAQGTPVLAAHASCLPEVYGEAAEYFDPRGKNDLVRKIDQLLGDSKRLDELKSLGHEQIKKYSWGRMAKETLVVYQKLLGGE